jgi:hypothetical protein
MPTTTSETKLKQHEVVIYWTQISQKRQTAINVQTTGYLAQTTPIANIYKQQQSKQQNSYFQSIRTD